MRWFGRDPERLDRARAERCTKAGMKLSGEGRFEEAIVEFERAVELQPNLLEARVNLAAAWYQLAVAREAGALPAWLDEAIGHYRYVLGIDPDNVAAQLGLAACHNARGESDKGLRILSALARSYPRHRDVFYNLAVAHLRNGDEGLAREALATELANHPDNPHALALQAKLAETGG